MDHESLNSVPNVCLRPYEPGDEEFLFEVYSSTRAEEMAAWGLDPAQKDMLLRLQFKAQRQHYDIAFEGAEHAIILNQGQSIGRMLVYRSEQEICLVDIALLPEFRGRGIGGELIGHLQAEAAEAQKPFRLHVAKENRAARLYERLGFSVIGDTGTHFKMEWTCRA